MGLTEIRFEGMNWIHLSQDGAQFVPLWTQ